jgi:hypothetical protein
LQDPTIYPDWDVLFENIPSGNPGYISTYIPIKDTKQLYGNVFEEGN